MVSRAFCIPGIFFVFAATVLLIVTSISLPYLPALDIVRVHVNSGTVVVGTDSSSQAIDQLRVCAHLTYNDALINYNPSLVYGLSVQTKARTVPEIAATKVCMKLQ